MSEELAVRPSRRGLLLAGGAGLAAGVTGIVTVGAIGRDDPDGGAPAPASDGQSRATMIDPHGVHQAGTHRPLTPPTHLSLHVFESGRSTLSADDLGATLAELGTLISALTTAEPRHERLSAPPVDLTVQVGVGPRVLAAAGLTLDVQLPEFAGSAAIPARRRRGDVVVSVAARHPEISAQASDVVAELLTAAGFAPSWSQLGFRPQGEGTIAANPLGFDDGIVQPATADGVPEHVYLDEGPAKNGTIGVVRRFVLDTAAFARLDRDEQERVFGRDKATGAPLSGGSRDTDVNLGTKTATGEYLVPAGSHVRAAHPSFTGSTLMLRRSYGYRESVDGRLDRSGLLFISFQDDLEVFSRTQSRMDREDRLMEFATATAEVAFLVLPGFDAERPLGSSLFS